MRKSTKTFAARVLLVAVCVGLIFGRLAAAEAVPLKADILSAYVRTAAALASDDLKGATAAAAELADKADIADQHLLAKQAEVVANATALSAAREAFKPLSAAMEPLAVGEKGYTIMTCPMAKADWVQHDGAVENPYLGQAMRDCGHPKKVEGDTMHGCGDGSHPGCGM